MEAFNSNAQGVRLLIAIVFSLMVLGLLSLGVSLAELAVGCAQLRRCSRGEFAAIPVYLIVSGLFGLACSLANGACLRGRLARRRQNPHHHQQHHHHHQLCCCLVYLAGGLGHAFSLAWLAAGFYWLYFHQRQLADPPAAVEANATTAAAVATASWNYTSTGCEPRQSAGRSRAAALPLLWLRLTICLLELAIVAAMLACSRTSATAAAADKDDADTSSAEPARPPLLQHQQPHPCDNTTPAGAGDSSVSA